MLKSRLTNGDQKLRVRARQRLKKERSRDGKGRIIEIGARNRDAEAPAREQATADARRDDEKGKRAR